MGAATVAYRITQNPKWDKRIIRIKQYLFKIKRVQIIECEFL